MVRLLSAVLLLAAAVPARAAFPPRVEVRPLTKRTFPRSVANFVGVGDCFAMVPLPERTEIAFVTVEVMGPWERSAEHVAKQSAAEVGANCLHPLRDYEREEENYPVVRQYRAFLVTTVVSGAMGTFRMPAPASTFRPRPVEPPPAPPPPAAAAPPPARPAAPPEAPHGPVWFERSLLDSHEVILDLSRMSAADWAEVREDVVRYFRPEEVRVLERAYARGESVLLDLRERRVVRHEEDVPAPSTRGRLIRPLPL